MCVFVWDNLRLTQGFVDWVKQEGRVRSSKLQPFPTSLSTYESQKIDITILDWKRVTMSWVSMRGQTDIHIACIDLLSSQPKEVCFLSSMWPVQDRGSESSNNWPSKVVSLQLIKINEKKNWPRVTQPVKWLGCHCRLLFPAPCTLHHAVLPLCHPLLRAPSLVIHPPGRSSCSLFSWVSSIEVAYSSPPTPTAGGFLSSWPTHYWKLIHSMFADEVQNVLGWDCLTFEPGLVIFLPGSDHLSIGRTGDSQPQTFLL